MARPRLSLRQKIWSWLCSLLGHKIEEGERDFYCSRCGEILRNKDQN